MYRDTQRGYGENDRLLYASAGKSNEAFEGREQLGDDNPQRGEQRGTHAMAKTLAGLSAPGDAAGAAKIVQEEVIACTLDYTSTLPPTRV